MVGAIRREFPPRPASVRDLPRWVWEYLRTCFRIDTRTLALFRVVAALIIITELLARSRNFHYFYTDRGVVPPELIQERMVDSFSLYYYVNDWRLIALLFALQILFALQLLVGYRTRAAVVISFLFMVSIDQANPFITSYADTLLRLLLFWAMFLPLGERWSIDALHRDRAPRHQVASFATVFIMGQMVYMYVRNGFHKLEGDPWWDGTATPLILARDDFTFLLGEYTHHFTPLLEYGTYLWSIMMLAAWLLILLPGRLRYPIIPLFMGGHFLFAVTVRIGMFPYVAMLGLLLFLQTPFWEDTRRIARRLGLDPSAIHASITTHMRGVAAVAPQFELTDREFRTDIYNFLIGVIVITLVLVAAINGLQLAGIVADDVNHEREVRAVASTFNVDQPDFSIFAPNPGTSDRYYVFPAKTDSGDIVDVYNERNISWERPYDGRLHKQYGGYRERFYMNSIRRADQDDALPEILADWYCDKWEGDEGERLTHLNMWVVTEITTMETLNDPENREKRTRLLFQHSCDGDEEILIAPPPQ